MSILLLKAKMYDVTAKLMSILEHLLHLQTVKGHCVATLGLHDHFKSTFCGTAQLQHGELNTKSIFSSKDLMAWVYGFKKKAVLQRNYKSDKLWTKRLSQWLSQTWDELPQEQRSTVLITTVHELSFLM